jgi:hypothetical protein
MMNQNQLPVLPPSTYSLLSPKLHKEHSTIRSGSGELRLQLSRIRTLLTDRITLAGVRFKWWGENPTQHVQKHLLSGKQEEIIYKVQDTAENFAQYLQQSQLDIEFIYYENNSNVGSNNNNNKGRKNQLITVVNKSTTVRVKFSSSFLQDISRCGVACEQISLGGGMFGGLLVISCCIFAVNIELLPDTTTTTTSTSIKRTTTNEENDLDELLENEITTQSLNGVNSSLLLHRRRTEKNYSSTMDSTSTLENLKERLEKLRDLVQAAIPPNYHVPAQQRFSFNDQQQ